MDFDGDIENPLPGSAEEILVRKVESGGAVAILGEATDGKTRTTFEVCKLLRGFKVLRPRIGHLPADEAIELLNGQRMVLFLDDLDQFIGHDNELVGMIERIRKSAQVLGLVVACRDTEELRAIQGDQARFTTPLSRFFSDIQDRFRLLPLDEVAKKDLWRATRTDGLPESLAFHRTAGSICMEDGVQVMRDKFSRLTPVEQNCLYAIQLLIEGEAVPIFHRRLNLLMSDVFLFSGEPSPQTLRNLTERGFLRDPGDPVLPEFAYLRWWGKAPVVRYRGNREPDSDLGALGQMFTKHGDPAGLISLGTVHARTRRFAEALICYDAALSGASTPPEDLIVALLNKGVTLGKLNRSEEEEGVYDEIVRRFGEAPELAMREQVARALFYKGITLGQLNRSDEAVVAYDEVVRRFGEAPELALREQVAKALVNKGVRLGQLNRSEEAVGVYDEVVRRFGEAPELALREQVAKALVNKGVRLGQLNRSEEEMGVYEEVVRHFGEAPELTLREQVAKALFYKGITLGQLNRSKEEMGVYDEVVRRFGEAPELVLREQVAKALVTKGITLGQLNRSEEAVRVADEVVRRFGESPEPVLRKQVAKAREIVGLVGKPRTDD